MHSPDLLLQLLPARSVQVVTPLTVWQVPPDIVPVPACGPGGRGRGSMIGVRGTTGGVCGGSQRSTIGGCDCG
jgi:hypothetical protein